MKTMVKNIWILAGASLMAFFVACSADGPVQVITPKGDILGEDEYAEMVEKGEVDDQGNVIVKDTTAKSSSSKKVSSSSTKGSSSSEKATSSSSSAKDSSSSGEAESSSSEAKSSSSEEAESSSSEPESSATAGKETIINEEEIGTDDMTAVSDDAQSELDSLKEILDNGGSVDGFELADSEFNEETLLFEDFNDNDFFCFTGEGEWMQITREQLGKHIPHYKNGQAWGNFRQFDVKFMDACAAVYIRRK